MQHLIEALFRDDSLLTRCLSPLAAVVVALVSEDGQLLQANLGFRRILDMTDDTLTPSQDVRSFFVQPSFAQLLAIHPEAGRPIYQGIVNIGDINSQCRSLVGAVYRKGGKLLIIGEYDVSEMERLNAQVIELNEQLSITQRDLSRSNRTLHESEVRLMAMSLTDPLTGLANRRRLMEFLQSEIDRSQRYQIPFSIIMADIDFFKKVNDEFGHEVGDEALLGFSNLMKNNMRSVDLVARLGGEEFIIVMPNTSLEGAMVEAERLRVKTERLYFDSMQRGITASFGVAEFQGTGDANSLFKHVDEAMYASKQEGRNCVTAYTVMMGETNK
ncbi:MAG: GGDEF domain-containing protein [Thiobacillus sp.]|nr:GGDEF domain-containing protein [Thiobacillus sp.]